MFWRMLITSVAIAGCILLDNYVDLPYSLKGESGSVYYYFFGSVVFGGLFGVYLLPMLCVFPWYQNMDQHKYSRREITLRILKCGVTLALGYIMLIIILRIMNLPMLMDYEKQDIIDSVLAGEVFAHFDIIASGREILYFLIAILFAFCEGCLSGIVAEYASYHTADKSHVIISPAVCMVCLVYLGKYLRIPDDFRLDRWLLMRSVFDNSLLTVLIVVLITTVFLFLSILHLSKMRTQNDQPVRKPVNKGYAIGITLLLAAVLFLELADLMAFVNAYTDEFSVSVTPFSYPFAIGESFCQMVYMIFYLGLISLFVSKHYRERTRSPFRVAGRLITISLLMSGAFLIMSCLTLRHPEFRNEWKPVWSVLALRYSAHLSFDIPLPFIQNNTPLAALVISFILTNLCSVLLGTIYILGNQIRSGIGSVVSFGITLLDITAYNLLEFTIWAYSPLSWAQYVDYDGGGCLNQVHVAAYCAIFVILICINLLAFHLLKRREHPNG